MIDTMSKKRKKAFEMRLERKTFKEISKALGCSVDFARIMVLEYQAAIERMQNASPFVRALLLEPGGAKIVHALVNEFGSEDNFDQILIKKLGPKRILKADGLGPKSISTIADVLLKLRVIRSKKKWMSDPGIEAHRITSLRLCKYVQPFVVLPGYPGTTFSVPIKRDKASIGKRISVYARYELVYRYLCSRTGSEHVYEFSGVRPAEL